MALPLSENKLSVFPKASKWFDFVVLLTSKLYQDTKKNFYRSVLMCTPETILVDKTKPEYYKNFLTFDVALSI